MHIGNFQFIRFSQKQAPSAFLYVYLWVSIRGNRLFSLRIEIDGEFCRIISWKCQLFRAMRLNRSPSMHDYCYILLLTLLVAGYMESKCGNSYEARWSFDCWLRE